MHLHRRFPPSRPVIVLVTLFLALLMAAVGHPLVSSPEADPEPASSVASEENGDAKGPVVTTLARTPVPPAPLARTAWSGFAFDACRAPSQAVMDRWRVSSPFTGVGIYLGGIHRACPQEHLTTRWVARQLKAGWQLLPIWVGPQASCTGYDHRITGKPGKKGTFGAAQEEGRREAHRAAAKARALRIPPQEVLFYDIELFDTTVSACRRSSLAFLENWTKELHRLGYRSGVYSHVRAGISLLSRTGRHYERPDAVWYAWIDRIGTMPPEYVADTGFMRTSRVHQYALDTRVEFGGIPMDIDWDYVSLGSTSPASQPPSCDQVAARVALRDLHPGARGPAVRAAQCLVLPGDPHPTKTSGQYDAATARAVLHYQRRRGLPATGSLDRRTWISLLAHGHTPVLKKGSQGESVQRLQRTLNAALGHRRIDVDGTYGPATARAVKKYRKHLGLAVKPVVTARVWKALGRGRALHRP